MSSRREEANVLALTRRARILTVLLALVTALALVAGYLAARSLLTSPEQRASEAATMSAPPVTATVLREARQERVTLSGSISFPDSVAVPPPSSGDTRQILVSRRVTAGGELKNGDLIGEVSGVPLIALRGAFPLYRDIEDGARGKDVLAVQEALIALGYLNGSADGVMGPRTARAVTELLQDRGYSSRDARDIVTPAVMPVPDDSTSAPGGSESNASTRSASDDASSTDDPASPDETPPSKITEDSPEDSPAHRSEGRIPSGLFAMIPSLPATVLTTPVEVGADVSGVDALLTISTSDPVVTGSISTVQAVDITPGMPVALNLDGAEQTGKVSAIEENADTPELSTVTITPQTALDRTAVGHEATITITTRSTDGEVLTIPVGAVRSDADAEDYVLVPTEDGNPRKVPVQVVDAVDGAAVITPSPDLPEGTEVLLSPDAGAGEGAEILDFSVPSDGGAG